HELRPHSNLTSLHSRSSSHIQPKVFNEEVVRLVVGQVQYIFNHNKIEHWHAMGMINFSLTSPENDIPFCPNCYVQFDCYQDSGLIIVPVDLQYFINFELKDKAERLESGRPRQVPTSAQYRDHLLQKGEITEMEIEG
ncbi:hypothetical protein N7532_003941, partial [Penicillium argentinense]